MDVKGLVFFVEPLDDDLVRVTVRLSLLVADVAEVDWTSSEQRRKQQKCRNWIENLFAFYD